MSNNYVEIADAHLDGHRNIAFTNLKQRLDRDSKEIQELVGKVGNKTLNDLITEDNTSYIGAINEVKKDANNINQDIITIEGNISALQGNINTINNGINGINNDITAVENTLGNKVDKVTSTTANYLPKFSDANGNLKSSGVSVDDNNNLSVNTLKSTVADGASPLEITSTTKVVNLNADKLDDYDSTAFLRLAQLVSSIGTNGDSGYFKIPTDNKTFIVQWGLSSTGIASSNSGVWVTSTPALNYPIPFPEKIIYANGNTYQTGTSWTSGVVTTLSTIQVFLNSNSQTDANNRAIKWFAIGY